MRREIDDGETTVPQTDSSLAVTPCSLVVRPPVGDCKRHPPDHVLPAAIEASQKASNSTHALALQADPGPAKPDMAGAVDALVSGIKPHGVCRWVDQSAKKSTSAVMSTRTSSRRSLKRRFRRFAQDSSRRMAAVGERLAELVPRRRRRRRQKARSTWLGRRIRRLRRSKRAFRAACLAVLVVLGAAYVFAPKMDNMRKDSARDEKRTLCAIDRKFC